MLALVILGIGTAGLVLAAGRCIAVVRKARIFEDSRMLFGRVELEDPLALKEEIEEGTESGDFEGGPEGYRWSREISIVGENEEDGLFQVTTRVYWTDRGEEKYDEVVTYLFSPRVYKFGSTSGGSP